MAIINEKKLYLGSYGVSTKGVSVAGTTKVYNTIAERDADAQSGMFAFVRDATSDSTVTNGFAIYYKKSEGWKKVFEEEAMDRDIAELMHIQWDNVLGKPNSTSEEIDNAVLKAHEHANKSELDKIGFAEKCLTYGGEIAEAKPIKYTKWLQLVCPQTGPGISENLHCTVNFYSNPAMTDLIRSISTKTLPQKFKYYSVSDNSSRFEDVVADIPRIARGRFVIVDVEDIITNQQCFIRWVWQESDANLNPGEIVSQGVCVYPSITPTNNDSIGLVWSID